jgi:ribosomal protein S30
LTNNLELRSPNPQGEDQSVPELLIMGMSKLSKGEFHGQLHLGEYADVPIAGKKDQDERTAAKEKENQTQRDKEANEIRERLAAQASSSTAPANAGGAGGAASSSGSSNATK